MVPDLDSQISKSISSEASIFTAKAIAINLAVDIALESNETNVCIFSDSQSVLQALISTKTDAKTNCYILKIKQKYELFTKLFPLAKLKFIWIPSHVGIIGNESVDILAKNATKKNIVQIDRIPFTDFYHSVSKAALDSTNDIIRTKSNSKGAKYFQIFFQDKKHAWFHKKNLPRELIVSINRARSNHYHLAESLAKIKVVESPICKCGRENENINHVTWQCKMYDNQRTDLLKKLFKLELQLPLCIEIFITEPNIQVCQLIFEFLKNCKLKI